MLNAIIIRKIRDAYNQVAQGRRIAQLVHDGELERRLEGQIAALACLSEDVDEDDAQFLSCQTEIKRLCQVADALLIAQAKAAILASRHCLNPHQWRPEDLLEEAILYREQAALAFDPEQGRERAETALELARAALHLTEKQTGRRRVSPR
jgi:hypothetical protein